jgi:protein-L-isoaspartate O-methyltransferase
MRAAAVALLLCPLMLCLTGGCGRPQFQESAEVTRARQAMVDAIAKTSKIKNPQLLAAMRQIPRQVFVAADAGVDPYSLTPTQTAQGADVFSPLAIAMMLEELNPKPKHKMLVINPPQGYAAAVAAKMCSHVYIVVPTQDQASTLKEHYRQLDLVNVEVNVGDITAGWPEGADYNEVLVMCDLGQSLSRIADQMDKKGVLVLATVADPTSFQLMHVDNAELTLPKVVSLAR